MFKSLVTLSLLSAACLLALTSCACTDHRKPTAKNQDQDKEIADAGPILARKPTSLQAVAQIKPFKENQIRGKVVFKKVKDGVKITANIEGLTPGKHGFHVHEFGDCSGDGSAAGAHFNPTNRQHGGPDSPERHVGDLGNLVADEKGYAHYERVDKVITLEGENSIIGRSIIIHADEDDYKTQPAGASGAKIACGVIEEVKAP